MTELDPENIPQHVAIIMDGNGRWATQQGLPRNKGHEAGADSVRAAVRVCRDIGVKYLTLYAFSVENWIRPKQEITGLMKLLQKFLTDNEYELHENEVRFRAMGRISDLPILAQHHIKRVMKATEHYDKGTLILALSYGGRTELADAAQAIAKKVKKGELKVKHVDEQCVADHLYLPGIPDPDLMIRTSGEMRLSNFMLWQLSYSEFYVTEVLWPDFREETFMEAIKAYQKRTRRFGDIEAK